MNICVIVLLHLLYGTGYQRNIGSAETFATFKKSLKTFKKKKILMLIILCIHISSTCSFVNVIIDSCLMFFDDHSVMVSLLLLMSLIWNVCMFCVAELSASEHLFEISAI